MEGISCTPRLMMGTEMTQAHKTASSVLFLSWRPISILRPCLSMVLHYPVMIFSFFCLFVCFLSPVRNGPGSIQAEEPEADFGGHLQERDCPGGGSVRVRNDCRKIGPATMWGSGHFHSLLIGSLTAMELVVPPTHKGSLHLR